MRQTISSWLSMFGKLGFNRKRRRSNRGLRRCKLRGYSRNLCAELLEIRSMLSATADIIFIADESGSADDVDHQWIATIAGQLDNELTSVGITNNRFGLVGMGGLEPELFGHSHVTDPLSSSKPIFGTAAELATTVGGLEKNGAIEDGWDGIEHALAEYDFRDEALVYVVLVSDESRLWDGAPANPNALTFDGVRAALQGSNAVLTTVVSASYQLDEVNNLVFGVEADNLDGATDQAHIAHVFGDTTQTMEVDDVLQINYQASNTGAGGYVHSNRSISISTETQPGIGPSEFGYSAELLGSAAFEDISTSPNAVVLLTGALGDQDDIAAEITSGALGGFTFDFFGSQMDHLFVSTNGLITFEFGDDTYTNSNWETSPPSQPSIAAFWDDLYLTVEGEMLWEMRGQSTSEERLIIQWDDANYYESLDPSAQITFQAILYADGRIQLNYQDLDGDENSSGDNAGTSSTVGIAASFEVTEVVPPIFNEGEDSVFDDGFTFDEYVKLGWSTGGAAWDLGVIRTYYSSQGAEIAAFDEAFVTGAGEQLLYALDRGRAFREGEPLLAINVGGPAVGSYVADTLYAPSGTTVVPAVPVPLASIDITSNSIPDNAPAAIFQQGRALTSGTDMVWSFDSSTVPDGRYVVELFFSETDSAATANSRKFDVLVEGMTVLDDYSIFADRAKIETLAHEVSAPNGIIDVSEGGVNTAIVKRFEVNVGIAEGAGLQIMLHTEVGNPLLTGLRILDISPPPSADFDLDGDVDGLDFLTWQRGYGAGTTHSEGDANYDGVVDGVDLAVWELQYGAPVIGYADFDVDGDVDGADFLTWQAGYGSGTTHAQGDANYDGAVDALDLAVWESQYGYVGGPLTLADLKADFDDDGQVGASDYLILQQNLGMVAATNEEGDVNYDGIVDGFDVLAYELVYDKTHPENTLTTSSVNASQLLQPGQILVSTLTDEVDSDYSLGDLSLREALLIASQTTGADTIVFCVSGTISLNASLGQLVIGSNMTIDGPGANLLSVSGNSQSLVFKVNSGVTATIQDLFVTAGSGGGIKSEGFLTVDRVAVENNSGSGISVVGGSLMLKNSTIAGNIGATTGGGVSVTNGPATIINSTISGNRASSVGGGVFVFTTGVQIIQSTITANRSNFGSGIYAPSGILLHNSIVANNLTLAGTATNNDVGGSVNSASSYNLIGVGGGFTNGVNGNIVLGAGVSAGLTALGNYGGPLKTHALLSTSAAIDAGDNAVALTFGLDEDQRGEDRIVDWDLDLDARVDIGAVELAFDEVYS